MTRDRWLSITKKETVHTQWSTHVPVRKPSKSRIPRRRARSTREIRRLLSARPVCATCPLASRGSVRTRCRGTWALETLPASKTPRAAGCPGPRSQNWRPRSVPLSGPWAWRRTSAGLKTRDAINIHEAHVFTLYTRTLSTTLFAWIFILQLSKRTLYAKFENSVVIFS